MSGLAWISQHKRVGAVNLAVIGQFSGMNDQIGCYLQPPLVLYGNSARVSGWWSSLHPTGNPARKPM